MTHSDPPVNPEKKMSKAHERLLTASLRRTERAKEKAHERTPMQNYFARVSIDRLLVIVLIIAVLIVGWTSVQNTKDYQQFTRCTVTYLTEVRDTSAVTTAAARALLEANNEASGTITDLLQAILAAGTPLFRTEAQVIAVRKSVLISEKAFVNSDVKYKEYLSAVKNNPAPPDPAKLCRD